MSRKKRAPGAKDGLKIPEWPCTPKPPTQPPPPKPADPGCTTGPDLKKIFGGKKR